MEIRLIDSKERKCGSRHRGMYATGGMGEDGGVVARFVPINPPIPYQVKLHRGPRLVSDNKILNRQPMNEWWVGSSKNTEVKKAGDAWAIDTFGMTLAKRLSTGVCAGAKTADDAVKILAQKVTWSNKIVHWFGELSKRKFQEQPRCAEAYAALYDAMNAFISNQKMPDLLQFHAAVWRAAYNIPPSKRVDFIPVLIRMQILLGLPDDASAMQRTFLQ